MLKVKDALASIIRPINGNIALCLSSGIDSKSLLFECISQNKTVTAYTFCLDGVNSRDYTDAKKTCDIFNVKHVRVNLPTDLDQLVSDIKLIKKMGGKKKTDIECFWPFIYTYSAIPTGSTILSGLGADGHFCISKKGMIHFKDKIEQFRQGLFDDNPTYAQKHLHLKINRPHVMPFLMSEVRNVFRNKSWEELNKPIQKYPIILAYHEYFKKVSVFSHTNLQLGDSGIASLFERLLKSKYNTGNFKSVIGVYNRL